MRLVQFERPGGSRAIAASYDGNAAEVPGFANVRALALAAIAKGKTLSQMVEAAGAGAKVDVAGLLAAGRVLAPIDHPDPAHMFVTGTGITHLGSAQARNAMHKKIAGAGGDMSDSMKMYQLGIEGGKPTPGRTGAQPEWFYKGDGSCVVRPGAPLAMPDFALAGGEEAEIVGIYIVADDGTPRRIGFVLGNEFSDHVVEQQNYLYGAHSKLRVCAFGPELLTGDLPADTRGVSRVLRGSAILWEGEFLSGESNMSHSLANLEHHHFKYSMFRRPGDIHCHFFGAATFSFAHGIHTQPGDEFELDVPVFGRPLRNKLETFAAPTPAVRLL